MQNIITKNCMKERKKDYLKRQKNTTISSRQTCQKFLSYGSDIKL